jgi:hypothetical protein
VQALPLVVGDALRPVYMTGFVTRHPAVATNLDAPPDRSPAGPLFFTTFHTEKTEQAIRGPAGKLLSNMLLVKPDLKELRPLYDSRPTVIFTDQDKALMNGLCHAFNGFSYVLEINLHCEIQPLSVNHVQRRWDDWLKYLEAKLSTLPPVVEQDDAALYKYILNHQRGPNTKNYTVMRLCISHWTKAAIDHGVHGAHFKDLCMPG